MMRRAQALLLAAEGTTDKVIAEQFRMSVTEY
jgi:hypothetical protein